MTKNLEYIAALLHGRRSRMAEGARLQALCRLRTVLDFGRAVLGDTVAHTALEVELQLVQRLGCEVSHLAPHLAGPVSDLLQWLVARFQVEDLKLLLRGVITGAPLESLRVHLVPLPTKLQLPVEALAKAESLPAFVRLMPSGILRRSLTRAMDFYHEQPHVFFFESALDQGYFAELLTKADRLGGEDRELVRPVIVQELDTFHLMLALRGKLLYGLEPLTLQPFHLAGTRISKEAFETMLGETEVRAMTSRGLGRVVDGSMSEAEPGQQSPETSDPAVVEKLAWSRFWRLANRAFRRSHMGAATVVAYVELRRVEVANLITGCEGIRTGMPAELVGTRLIPLGAPEATYV